MGSFTGRVAEVRTEAGCAAATIACPGRAVPGPGQYAQASAATDVLGAALFYAGEWQGGFLAAPPLPTGWAPGTPLALRGPLGRGFRLPENLQRLALVAAGDCLARLLPLAAAALARGAAVTLFTDLPLPPLPASLEAYPLGTLKEALAWADFLAVDLPLDDLTGFDERLGLSPGERLPCPGQILLHAPMPCAGLSECGACAIRTRRGWKLACADGPVFDLREIMG
ncbi:MAG TPA: hypothetical protein VI776_16985 [Anaerolineales bacterium]|nr:hypothetical protein [Anaerolineales bacterium]